MVNLGWNSAAVLGLLYVVFAFVYPVIAVLSVLARSPRLKGEALVLAILQSVIVFLFLFVAGAILLFNGWRLDPILQFVQILLTLLLMYFMGKDLLLMRSQR